MRRRRVLGAALLVPLEGLAQTCGSVTPRQTEGPFFKTESPRRISLLEPSSKAPRLVLTGTVLSAQCKPVPNALLDFWHSDEEGAYDNRGFRYRGHQHADSQGRYRLETIVPAEYPGRTRHIHVKVQAPASRKACASQKMNEPAAQRAVRLSAFHKATQKRTTRSGVSSATVAPPARQRPARICSS